MSETLQEFCKRILPVVKAGAEGKKIEERLSTGNGAWEGKIARLFLVDWKYRIAEPKATPLPITHEMWAMIDPKYKFAYLSASGIAFFCAIKLEWLGNDWVDLSANVNNCCTSPLNIDTTGIIPELSLTKRHDVLINNKEDVYGAKAAADEFSDNVISEKIVRHVAEGEGGTDYLVIEHTNPITGVTQTMRFKIK